MGVTYDRIIPTKAADSGESDSILNEAEVAAALIERLSAGCNETVAELEVLSLCVGAGTGCPTIVKRVLAKMKEESLEMRKVNPTDFTKLADYEAELAKKAEVITPTQWTSLLKAAYEVTTFTALQAEIVKEVGELEIVKDLAEKGL